MNAVQLLGVSACRAAPCQRLLQFCFDLGWHIGESNRDTIFDPKFLREWSAGITRHYALLRLGTKEFTTKNRKVHEGSTKGNGLFRWGVISAAGANVELPLVGLNLDTAEPAVGTEIFGNVG